VDHPLLLIGQTNPVDPVVHKVLMPIAGTLFLGFLVFWGLRFAAARNFAAVGGLVPLALLSGILVFNPEGVANWVERISKIAF
jgi:hypothetical protein